LHADLTLPHRLVPRYLPPVHFPLPAGQLLRAALSGLGVLPDQRETATAWLEARFPGREALLTGSGTMALGLALEHSAAVRGPTPSRVALPAYGCPDLGTAAVAAGGTIALYDLDPHTLQPDWESVRSALAHGATHLVVTHLYGRATDVAEAVGVAQPFGAIVIEDAAQGADAFMRGVPCGSLAEWSIFSLGRGKGINAGGGGILVSPQSVQGFHDSLRRASRMQEARRVWVMLATQLLAQPHLYGVPAKVPALGLGDTVYHPPEEATAIYRSAAAVLRSAFETSASAAAARRRVEGEFLQAFGEAAGILLPRVHAESVSGALRVPILIAPALALPLKRLGVARSYPRALDEYPELAGRLFFRQSLPGARQLSDLLHTLPTHRHVSPQDQRRIVEGLTRPR
jgi:perosamine synthetase